MERLSVTVVMYSVKKLRTGQCVGYKVMTVSHGCSLFLNKVHKTLFTFRLAADLCFYLQHIGNVRGPWQRCKFQ